MRKIVGLWALIAYCASVPVFSQVDTSYIYNTSTPYGTLDLRIRKSDTRYYYLQEDVTFSFRESSPGVKTNTYHDMTSWDSSPYRQGNMREKNGSQDLFIMNYRFLMPQSYDPNYDKGYPIILMLHGYGERGNCWFDKCYWSTTGWNPNTNSPPAPTTNNHVLLNNDHNLLHGGNPHLNAVKRAAGKYPDDPTLEENAFSGFVLFPQVMNGWQQSGRVEDAIKLLRLIIKKYNIDENRVYIHGLSNGGGGVFQAIKRAPWLFAAALGMSAVTYANIHGDGLAPEVGKIPMWVFQGGKDTNPTPSRTYLAVRQFREAGAEIRYSLYPNLGHGTWNTAYNEKDFFSWIRSKRKNQPHVFYGNPVVCNTNGKGVQIAFSRGFFAYQWEMDGVVVAGANSAEFVAQTPGVVRGRFSRKANPAEADWEPWSDPIVVTEISPAKPTIEVIGSTHLRGPGLVSLPENNTVTFKSNLEAELYTWYRNGAPVQFTGTDIHDTLRTAKITSAGSGANGAYTLTTSFSFCPSPPSDPVNVFFNNSAPQVMTIDPAAAAFKASIVNSGVMLSWNDLVSKESAYEVWRKRAADPNFSFAGKAPKDALNFYDTNLQPNTVYQYKLRAVGSTGVSNYLPSNTITDVVSITTPVDTEKPSAPEELRIVSNALNSITLAWKPAHDNAAIHHYLISYGSGAVSTDTAMTTFTVTGLPANSLFPITVKAVDYAGLESSESNQVIGSTYVLGLRYKHSTGAWEDLDDPTMVATWADPEFTGTVNNFSLTPRTQEDFFNFQYTGYIDIPATGQYLFRLASGDGSRLLIDNTTVIDNDGIHGTVTKFSDTLTLTQGPHPIEVQYFDYSGAHTLTVNYKGPLLTNPYRPIPDSLLRSGKFVPPGTVTPPSGLVATVGGMQRIDISWASNGDAAEIYRAAQVDGPFQMIGKSTVGSLVDSAGISPGTTYYYKARTVTSTGVSAFSAVVSAATSTDNIAPSAPTNLTLSNKSHTVVAMNWNASTDNTGVAFYEILGNGTVLGTSEITSYMATGLLPNTNYIFTIVAIDGNGNRSAASQGLAVSTNPSAMFYSLASGNLNDVATWRQNPDGTGNAPVDFSENGQHFIITNRTQTTTGGRWEVLGSASKVVVSNGVLLTIDSVFTGTMEVQGNGIVQLNGSSTPDFSVISASSTVRFNGATQVPAKSYGNLVLEGTGTKSFDAGILVVNGDLSIADGLTLQGASGNQTIIEVGGHVNINGVLNAAPSDSRIAFTFSPNATHTVSAVSDIAFHSWNLSAQAIVSINTPAARRITLGSVNGGGLQLASGSLLNVGSNTIQTIGESAINPSNESGAISIDGGDIKIRSLSGASSYLNFSATANMIDTLQVDAGTGSVHVQSDGKIKSSIVIKSGNLNASGHLVLLSDAAGTANIAPIENNGSISGSLTVQQYIAQPGPATRELSVAVEGATISQWQQHFPITGVFAGSSGGSEPSLFKSNGTTLEAYPASNGSSSSPLENGRGYSTRFTTSSPITVSVSGVPSQHAVVLPMVAGQNSVTGWNLVGNPYASPIYWRNGEGFMKSGIGNAIAVKQTISVNGQLIGQYKYITPPLSQAKIDAGQAFWVHAYGSSPMLTVDEKAKVSSETSPDTVSWNYVVAGLKQGSLEDEAYVIFIPEATDNFDHPYDFVKRPNEGMFNLSTLSGTDVLAVNAVSNSFCSKAVNLNIQNASPGAYALTFKGVESLTGVGVATLTDNFLNKTITLSNLEYTFEITSDPASSGSSRFILNFSRFQLNVQAPVAQGHDICSGDNASVTLSNVQDGVSYVVVNAQGEELSEPIVSEGEDLTFLVPIEKLASGANTLRIRAGFPGCTSQLLNTTATVNYAQDFELSVSEDLSVCVGDRATLQATGVPADGQYQWLDEEGNVLATGSGNFETDPIDIEKTYQVIGILASGCQSTAKSIQVYPDTLDVPVIIFHNDTLVTQVEATYQWYRNGEPITGADKAYFVPATSGDYTVMASSSGCSKQSIPYQFVVDPGCQADVNTPVATGTSFCGEGSASITITNTQQGVTYSVINPEGETISSNFPGNGGTIEIVLGSEALDSGRNELTIRVDMAGCADRTLQSRPVIDFIPAFTLSAEDSVFVCEGQEASLVVTGGPSTATYRWENETGAIVSTGNTPALTIGPVTGISTYKVKALLAAGCESEPVTIVVTPVVLDEPVISVDGDILSIPEAEGVYQWFLNDTPIENATGPELQAETSGKYSVTITNGNCSVESAQLDFILTGTEGQAKEFSISVYPNPAHAANLKVFVQSPSVEQVSLQMVDMSGRVVFERVVVAEQLIQGIPLNSKAPIVNGLYYIIARQGRGEIRKKVVIRN